MRLSSQVLVTLIAWLMSLSAALAAGFGAAPGSVNLGSPLSVSVALHLDEQDSAEPDCVSAEVSLGDRRVPAYNVRWVVEPTGQARERIVRVSTLTAIDEPVVNIQLTAGCGTRIARRYTIFADPPMVTATPTLAETAAPSGALATPAPAGSQSAPPSSAANRSSPSNLAVAKPSVAPQRIAAAAGRQAGAASKQRARKVAKAATRSNRAVASGATPKVKLTLEPGEPPAEALALAAAMQAAASSAAAAEQSASAAIGAASAAAARADALEQRVERLLTDAKQQRADNEQLRSRLAAESWSNWMWVGLLVATLVCAVAWLAWRLRRVQREAQAQWWKAAQAEVMADLKPDPDDTQSRATTLDTPQRPSAAPQPAPAKTGRTSHDSPPVDPQEAGWTTITPPRPVTAEELIDLEQQAEFFVVLGQDDAAVDLLVAHIRNTGGISPLPYLKLLEIYRRRSEPDTYERTRTRFNQRFNAYAPDWDSDLQAGRSLEDYPDVIASLQRCWSMPLDAMAELEALLFRKERGELFDLPAYREVMLLYSLARDLHEDQAEASNPIDLLLPLDAFNTRPATVKRVAAGPYDTQLLGPQASVDTPTTPAPLDFDLSSSTTFDRDVTAPAAFNEVGSTPSSQRADLPGLDALVRGRRDK